MTQALTPWGYVRAMTQWQATALHRHTVVCIWFNFSLCHSHSAQRCYQPFHSIVIFVFVFIIAFLSAFSCLRKVWWYFYFIVGGCIYSLYSFGTQFHAIEIKHNILTWCDCFLRLSTLHVPNEYFLRLFKSITTHTVCQYILTYTNIGCRLGLLNRH